MLKILNKNSQIKDSNIVILVEKNQDIAKLDFLKLDKKIEEKIKSSLKENENKTLIFYIGAKHIENLYVHIFQSKGNKTLVEFLGEEVPKLPINLTFLTNSDKNLLKLLDAAVLSRYKFNNYKTEKKEDKIAFLVEKKYQNILEERFSTLENILLARDLGDTPACDLSPENFAQRVKKSKWKNTKIKIIGPGELEKKGFGLIHAVGKGSANKPYMVILERIVDKKAPTYGLVGKGVVFDSGGLDIKTQMMYEMKDDMCGAGTVFATMKELDKKDINVNIVACLCLAENFISSESYRPSDILTSYSGKTVNVINTDAEGRLVMADGISYLSQKYNTDHIMSVATLTGVALFALGYRYAGIMGTDRKIIDKLVKSSKTDFEKYCELPFDTYYVEQTKSKIADLDNLNRGVYAGSTMGGAFLYNFLENNEKYTHIDIAGVANNCYEPYGLYAKGSTGFGVDSLSKLFLNL